METADTAGGVHTASVSGLAPSDVVDALNFALLLEYLEADFYSRASSAAGLIPSTDRAVFAAIGAHETAHVGALQTLIQGRGGTPQAKPGFDYTAKGAVNFAFLPTQYETFKQLAQVFEDLGVRAYKGQLSRLIGDNVALTTAMTIHSVEGRHASEVRRLRGLKGWISGNSRDDLPVFAQPVYDGEDNALQGAVSVGSIVTSNVSAPTEAFDEPLTMAAALAIITPFLA